MKAPICKRITAVGKGRHLLLALLVLPVHRVGIIRGSRHVLVLSAAPRCRSSPSPRTPRVGKVSTSPLALAGSGCLRDGEDEEESEKKSEKPHAGAGCCAR